MNVKLAVTWLLIAIWFENGTVLNSFAQGTANWECVGGDRGCARYSVLDEINAANVVQLEVAWKFRTGELVDGNLEKFFP